jgi:TorA-specific chaperone
MPPYAPASPTRDAALELLTWLAATFSAAPTAETIAALRGAASPLLDTWADDEAVGSALRRLFAVLGDLGSDTDAAATLNVVFANLFLGIGGPQSVAPYESVQRYGCLSQEPARVMADLLAQHDLGVAEAGELPDHIAIELALLAALARSGSPAFAVLRERMAEWVPGFAARVRDRDPSGYFAAAATLLATLLGRAGLL